MDAKSDASLTSDLVSADPKVATSGGVQANHRITVLITGTGENEVVSADVNPLSVEPGDNVTWVLPTVLEVRFTRVQDLSTGDRTDTVRTGPFVSPLPQGNQILGTVITFPRNPSRSHRFFYQILRNGTPLRWASRVEGAPDLENGGGVDVPGRPPGT